MARLSFIQGDDSLPPIGDERLFDAVNIILTFQNRDGGWATYENTRGFRWSVGFIMHVGLQ